MDKRTRKNQVSEKKAKKSRVQEFIEELKINSNSEKFLKHVIT